MKREFVEMPAFRRSWTQQRLTDEELRKLQLTIVENPKAGSVIQDTGGLRKLRLGIPPAGKSGSLRVIYVDFERYYTTYLVYAYAKNEKEDITDEEKATFKKVIGEIEESLKVRKKK